MESVSVVISTYERPDACERAMRSVLAQTHAALEILVCDDGSSDDTPSRARAWEREHPHVRYLPLERNTGRPAPARNRGIGEAQGEWVAFLDDDDEWLPEKLERQLGAGDGADVVASNALTAAGRRYFPANHTTEPARRDLLRRNPLILSSAIVRRRALTEVGGFDERPALRGVEDYALWLALADRQARFVVLAEPLVRYADDDTTSLSHKRTRAASAIARLAWERALTRPDGPKLTAAARWTAGAAVVTGQELWSRARNRNRGR